MSITPANTLRFGVQKSARRRANVPGHGTEGMTSMRDEDYAPKVVARFWMKVGRSGDCWEWSGADTTGYGHFRLPGRRDVLAHRYAYEYLIGPIPGGLQLDHLCRNRRCVNPEHLEPVTQAENIRRAAKTHCVHGHELAGDNLYIDERRSSRECRTCRRAAMVAFRQRQAGAG